MEKLVGCIFMTIFRFVLDECKTKFDSTVGILRNSFDGFVQSLKF